MFRDKKAREAIEQMRIALNFAYTCWNAPFLKEGVANIYVKVLNVNKKLNLILDHLNLEYVAETEKKEPAKLVEKKTVMTIQEMYPGITTTIACSGDSYRIGVDTAEEPKKKKRGRPKKK